MFTISMRSLLPVLVRIAVGSAIAVQLGCAVAPRYMQLELGERRIGGLPPVAPKPTTTAKEPTQAPQPTQPTEQPEEEVDPLTAPYQGPTR